METLELRGPDASGLATLTLNRPGQLNSLDGTMVEELEAALTEVAANREIRVLRLMGAGRGFMAGGDLRWFAGMFGRCSDPDQRRELVAEEIRSVHRTITAIDRLAVPVVAQVHGACAGFGLSLALACDLVICARDSKITLAYTGIGTSPDGGSTYQLNRLIGRQRAMQMALLNERIDGDTACSWGLFARAVDRDLLEEETLRVCMQLADGPLQALVRTRKLLRDDSGTLEQVLEAEAISFAECAAGEEFPEGVQAFIDKRPADYRSATGGAS
ncbi:MAG: enoyl-CoA hydratase-related protein [Planctomycetota bacterium]|nr:enoyl-CoA hydratase-related protein [Planctomycetota bacterium]